MIKRLIPFFLLLFCIIACAPEKKAELSSLCTKENESYKITVDAYVDFPAIGCTNAPVYRECSFFLKNDPSEKPSTVSLNIDVGDKNNQAREPDRDNKNTVELIAADGSRVSPGDKVTIYGRIFVLNDQQNSCWVKDVSRIEKKIGQ